MAKKEPKVKKKQWLAKPSMFNMMNVAPSPSPDKEPPDVKKLRKEVKELQSQNYRRKYEN